MVIYMAMVMTISVKDGNQAQHGNFKQVTSVVIYSVIYRGAIQCLYTDVLTSGSQEP